MPCTQHVVRGYKKRKYFCLTASDGQSTPSYFFIIINFPFRPPSSRKGVSSVVAPVATCAFKVVRRQPWETPTMPRQSNRAS